MEIRPYNSKDYPDLKNLYDDGGWFDALVDSQEILDREIQKNQNAILVALSEGKVVGTVSLLFTGRLALFFRLVSPSEDVRKQLLAKGEEIFVGKGYGRLDIIAPEEDLSRQDEYVRNGFNKGSSYRWFWKERK
jgi:hypothetical protein